MKNRRIIVLLAFLMLFQTFATGMAFATDELNAPLIELEDEIHNDGDGPADDSNGLEGPVDSDDNAGPDDEGTSGDDDSDQGNANDNESTPTENPENEGEGGTSHDENLDDPDQTDGNNEIENPDGDEDANEDATDDNDSSETDEESDGNEQLEADGESDDTGLDEEGTEPTEENLVAAQAVIDLINYIDLETEVNGEYVVAVRAMFDALTPEQQALVTNVDVLLLAETMVGVFFDTDGLGFGVMSDDEPIVDPVEFDNECDTNIAGSVCLSTGYQFGKIVLGQERTVDISMKNNGGSYMYNVGLQLVIPDGMEFVSAELEPSSDEFDENTGEQIVYWQDIKNLQADEEFVFHVKIKSLEDFRFNLDDDGNPILDEEGEPVKKPVNFGEGLPMTANVYYSNEPRTIVGPSNEPGPPFVASMNWTIVPFTIIPSGSHKVVKGAGADETGDSEWGEFGFTIDIVNNSRYETRFSYVNSHVDGSVQIYGLSSNGVIGTDDYENNKRNFGWTGVSVGKGASETLSFKGAFLNQKMAVPEEPETNGNNIGAAIKDGFRAIGQLSYAAKAYHNNVEVVDAYKHGHIDVGVGNFDYNMAVAKDIIIDKTVSKTKGVGYADTLTYNLTITTNEYYDVDHVVVTDTIGDGQTFSSFGAITKTVDGQSVTLPDPPTAPNDKSNGLSIFNWNLGTLNPKTVITLEYTVTVDDKWSGNVENHIAGNYIYAGDQLVNRATVIGNTEVSGIGISDESHTAASINTPTISERITKLNTDSKDVREINATVGDTVEFTIEYKAGNVNAKQNKVEIRDYLPLGTKLVGYSGLLTESDPFPMPDYNISYKVDGNTLTATPDYYPSQNMLVWDLPEIDKNEIITTTISVLVLNSTEHVTKDKGDQNLVTLSFANSPGIVKSDRDSVKLDYTEPELTIERKVRRAGTSQWLDEIDVHGKYDVEVKLEIKNIGESTAYDVVLTEHLPEEFAIEPSNFVGDANDGYVYNSSTRSADFRFDEIEVGSSKIIIYSNKIIDGIELGSEIKQNSKIEYRSQPFNSDNPTAEFRPYTKTEDPVMTMWVPDPSVTFTKRAHGSFDNDGPIETSPSQWGQVRVGDWVIYKVEVIIPDGDKAVDPSLTIAIPNGQKFEKVLSQYGNHSDITNSDYIYDEVENNFQLTDNNIEFGSSLVPKTSGTYTYYIVTTVMSPNDINDQQTHSITAEYGWSKQGTEGPISKTDSFVAKTSKLEVNWFYDKEVNKESTDYIFVEYDSEHPALLSKDDYLVMKFVITNAGKNNAHDFTPVIAVDDGFVIMDDVDADPDRSLSTDRRTATYTTVPTLNIGASKEYIVKVQMQDVKGSGANFVVEGTTGQYYSNFPNATDRDDYAEVDELVKLAVSHVEINNTIEKTTNGSENEWIRPGDIITYNIDVIVPAGTQAFGLTVVDIIGDHSKFDLISGEITWNQDDSVEGLAVWGSSYNYSNGELLINLGNSPHPNGVKNKDPSSDDETVIYTIIFDVRAKSNGTKPTGDDAGSFGLSTQMFNTTAIAKWFTQAGQFNPDDMLKTIEKTTTINVRQPDVSIKASAGEYTFIDDEFQVIEYTITNDGLAPAIIRDFVVDIPAGFVVTKNPKDDPIVELTGQVTWSWNGPSLDDLLVIAPGGNEKLSFYIKKTADIGAAQKVPPVKAILANYYSTDIEYVEPAPNSGQTTKQYTLDPLFTPLKIAGVTLNANLEANSYTDGGTGESAKIRPGDVLIYEVDIILPGTSPAYNVYLQDKFIVTGQEIIAVENHDGTVAQLGEDGYGIGDIPANKTIKVITKVTTTDPIPTHVSFEPSVAYSPLGAPGVLEPEVVKADALSNQIVEPHMTLEVEPSKRRLTSYGETSNVKVKVQNEGVSTAYSTTIKVTINHKDRFEFVKNESDQDFTYHSSLGVPTEVIDGNTITLTWSEKDISNGEVLDTLLEFTIRSKGYVEDVLDIVSTVVEYHSLPKDFANDLNSFLTVLENETITKINSYEDLLTQVIYKGLPNEKDVSIGGNHTLSELTGDDNPLTVWAGQTAIFNHTLMNVGGGKDTFEISVKGPTYTGNLDNYLASSPEDGIFAELLVDNEIVLIAKLSEGEDAEIEWLCPASAPTTGVCSDGLYTIELDPIEENNEVDATPIELRVHISEHVNYDATPHLDFVIHANSTRGKEKKSTEDTVIITGVTLDGWSGEVAKDDWENPPAYRHGIPLVLQAVTSNHVKSVYAKIEGTDIDLIKLGLVNEDSYIVDGQKQWEVTTESHLLNQLIEGIYSVTFTSYQDTNGDVEDKVDKTAGDKGENNPFELNVPELAITMTTDGDITKLNTTSDERKVTVTVTNSGGAEAHDVLVNLNATQALLFNFEEFPESGTWHIAKLEANTSSSIEFTVSSKADTEVNQATAITAELVEHYSLENREGKHVEPKIEVSKTISMVGHHTLIADDVDTVKAGQTATFEHILTNSGAGQDTFIIDVGSSNADFPGTLHVDGVPVADFFYGNNEWQWDFKDSSFNVGDQLGIELSAANPDDLDHPGNTATIVLDIHVPGHVKYGDTQYIYTIEAVGQHGGKSDHGQVIDTLMIDGQPLDGWSGPQTYEELFGDEAEDWEKPTYRHGMPFELHAVTANHVQSVYAVIDDKALSAERLALDLLNDDETATNYWAKVGYKLWSYEESKDASQSFTLLNDLGTGEYDVTFTSYLDEEGTEEDATDVTSSTGIGSNNPFNLEMPDVSFTLKAYDPESESYTADAVTLSKPNDTTKLQLTVTNSGSSPAYNLELATWLDLGLVIDSIEDHVNLPNVELDEDNTGFTWTIAELEVGIPQVVTFIVTVPVTTEVTDAIKVNAEVESYTSLSDGGRVYEELPVQSVSVEIEGHHDLSTDTRKEVPAGEIATFMHTLDNVGAGRDTFQLNLDSPYEAKLYHMPESGTPELLISSQWNEGDLKWEWDSSDLPEITLAAKGQADFKLDILVPRDTPKGIVTNHQLTATSVTNEREVVVTDVVEVIAPSLSLSLNATDTTLYKHGDTTTFDVIVENKGDHHAYNTEVIVTLSDGLFVTEYDESSVTVDDTGQTVTWMINSLEIDDYIQVSFKVGAYSNTEVSEEIEQVTAKVTQYFATPDEGSQQYPGIDHAPIALTIAGNHTLSELTGDDNPLSRAAGQLEATTFEHTLKNTGAGADTFDIYVNGPTTSKELSDFLAVLVEEETVAELRVDGEIVLTGQRSADKASIEWVDTDGESNTFSIDLASNGSATITLTVLVSEYINYDLTPDLQFAIHADSEKGNKQLDVTDTVMIDGQPLDGWSGSQTYDELFGDEAEDWEKPTYRHGMPFELHAVTANHVQSVYAVIDDKALSAERLALDLLNDDETATNYWAKVGYKLWNYEESENASQTFTLLNDIRTGKFNVTFTSYLDEEGTEEDATDVTSPTGIGRNNPFNLEMPDVSFTLKAYDPESESYTADAVTLSKPNDTTKLQLTVTNSGSSPAYNLELATWLDLGLVIDSIEDHVNLPNVELDEDGTGFAWTIDDLQVGTPQVVTLVVTVPVTTEVTDAIKVNAEVESYTSLSDGGRVYEELPVQSVSVEIEGGHTLETNDEQFVTAGTTAEFENHTLTNTGAGQDSYLLELTSTTDYPVTLHIDGVAVGTGEGDDSSVWTWTPIAGQEKWFEDSKPVITLEAGEPIDISLAVHVPETARYGHDYEYTIHAIGQLSGISGTEDTTVTNTLKITGTELDGWSGEFTHADIEDDRWNKPTYGQVDSVFIGAVSAVDVQSVSAEVTVDVVLEDGEPEKHTKKVMLELINDGLEDRDHYIEAGEKYWTGTIRLPVGTQASDYSLVFIALDGDDIELERDEVGGPKAANNLIAVNTNLTIRGTITEVELDEEDESTTHLPIESALVELYDPVTGELINSMETDEHGQYSFTEVEVARYKLVVSKDGYSNSTQHFYALPKTGENEVVVDAQLSPYQITLYANPTSILGDGESTTELTAIITDKDGKPIEGIVAHFSSPTNRGTFPEGTTETTDERGIAKVTFKSDKIGGTASVSFPVFMEVNDPVNELYASTQIVITFEPGAVVGVVSEMVDDGTGNGTKVRKLIANALVEVSNEEIGFYGSYVTGESGEYAIGVPVGGLEYHVSITKPFIIGDTEQSYTFRHKAEVGAMNAAVYETFPAVNSGSGMIMLQTPSDGPITTFDDDLYDAMEAFVVTRGGDPHDDVARIPVQVYEDGTFDVHGLAKGDYDLYITLKADMLDENDDPVTRTVAIAKSVLEISDEGEMNLTTELVDPYGDVRRINKDGPLIEGAKVTLYYADDDTEVHLPELLGFDPFDNLSPTQTTDHRGHYAWMVYPETDYYVVATAPGYRDYKSPNIRVDWDIVRHDIFMTPITPPGGGFFPPVIDEEEQEETEEGMIQAPIDLAISISADQRSYMEHSDIVLTIDYLNRSADNASQVRIILDLPQDAEVVDIGDGELSESGDQVIWYIEELSGGHIGTMDIVLRAGEITTSQQELLTIATITSEDELINLEDDKSTLKLMLFSNDYDVFTHVRYIQGYPDKEFKLNRNITRAEIATIFARILNLRPYVTHEQMYTDVAVGQWYADAIEAVTKRGLFNGYNDGTFRPDEPITRAELTSVIFRFMELDERPPVVIKFEDLHGHWAANIIEDVYRNRVAEGYVDGTFRPDQHLVRSEAVTMINRLLYRGPLHGVEPSYPDVPTDHWAFGDVEESTRSHDATRNEDTSEQLVRDIEATLDF